LTAPVPACKGARADLRRRTQQAGLQGATGESVAAPSPN
jgi:hypothetical protein